MRRWRILAPIFALLVAMGGTSASMTAAAAPAPPVQSTGPSAVAAGTVAAAGPVVTDVTYVPPKTAPHLDHGVLTTSAQTPPNVLVLNNDDQKNTALVGIPLQKYQPNFNHDFRNAGVTYNLGEVANPNCCPSRAVLLTGRYDHNNGVLIQDDGMRLNFNTTVEHYLSKAGYSTGIVGKFLNSWPTRSSPPDWSRFHIWESSSYTSFYVNDNGTMRHLTTYATDWCGQQALGDITSFEQRGRPWFEYVACHVPHTTKSSSSSCETFNADGTCQTYYPSRVAVPPVKYRNKAVPACLQPGSKGIAQPPFVRSAPPANPPISTVCRTQMQALTEYDLGVTHRLIQHLVDNGTIQNTLIFYVSDNGLLWGEHNLNGKFAGFLPSVAVPFVVRWDGHFAAGVRDNATLASNVDITPTILDATGVASDPQFPLDGHSLLQPMTRDTAYEEYWLDTKDSRSVPTWAQIHGRAVSYLGHQF